MVKENVYEASLEKEKMKFAKEGYEGLRRTAELDVAAIKKLLEGAFDVHAHSGPDTYIGRFYDDIDNAYEYCKWGLAGLALKCHGFPTARSARLVQRIVDEYAEKNGKKTIKVMGGVVLNEPVGGLNPEAVRTTFKFGSRFVWTPTLDASHHRKVAGKEGGIDVLDAKDKVLPPLKEIFDIIAENDMILSISHQSTHERFVMIEEAKKSGVKRILIDHPQQANTRMTIDQMLEVQQMGAYLGIYYSTMEQRSVDPNEVFEIIKRANHDRIVMGSDKGSIWGTHPFEGIRIFMVKLLNKGVPYETVRKFFVENPNKFVFEDPATL